MEKKDVVKPAALRAGDTIAIVAPAYPTDAERVRRATERLAAKGFHVRPAANLHKRTGYLAGSDEERAAEFMAAWRDPKVKAVFCGNGGYGVTRMLDRLDFDYIRAHPKVFVGFSDITGLHLALQRTCGLVTFSAKNIVSGFGGDQPMLPVTEQTLWRAILADSSTSAPAGRRGGVGYAYDLTDDAFTTEITRIASLSPGVGRGRLTGGNLSLVSALMGTPYEIETRGRILFLEDVDERPYRVDRYLSQMRLAGKLDKLAGVVLGRWDGCTPEKPELSYTVEEVLRHYFAGRPYPVILGFPVGHVRANVTIPYGVSAELDADRGILRLLEDPVNR